MKKCNKCYLTKELNQYSKNKNGHDGLHVWCKECMKKNRERKKEQYASNRKKNEASPEARLRLKQRRKKSYTKNREKNLQRSKDYYILNKEKIEKRESDPFKKARRRQSMSSYVNKRRHTDPIFKLIHNARCYVNKILKRTGIKKDKRTYELISLSGEAFLLYLESKFQPGMTRENQGNGKGKWHVDHIKPIAAFDKTDPNWIYDAFHYTNLQPLWSTDNLNKSSNFEGKKFFSLKRVRN